ncbi:family transcriptional regulator [Leptolyngbya sp. Heron Island J]|uniref:LysR family transcriptional regulator n=1 Tax=Leptolyngbya sp. Heron Island J TaxID=1385935 RepID=UPI0003B94C1F|nr:LysR family transcriptional regulator [Leptolyngbya sp. Heron Island J]ESA33582.1 family transcriptional regulator [Leptolyngbya sp. Heron Island J]
MDDFDLNDLRAFGLIANAGGLSPAARKFGQAKATLSRSLSRLETAAGVPLFDRVNRGLRLTPLGTRLLPTAEAAIALMLEADEALRVTKEKPQGPLKIAASALMGQKLLAPVIARLAQTYPDVKTTLQVTSQGPDPVVEDLDVVLRIGRPTAPYLVSSRIVKTALALYTFRTRASEIDLNDALAVEGLGRITINVAGVPQEWILSNNEHRKIFMKSEPLVAVGDPTVALSILSSGSGVACLPQIYAEPLAHAGILARALPAFSGPDIEIYAALPPKRSNVPAVRAFLDMLISHVAEIEKVSDSSVPTLQQ